MAEPISTPPIRTPLVAEDPTGGSAGRTPTRRTPAPTTKDWWLYWDSVTRGTNQNTAEIRAIEDLIAASVRIGTHAERLAAEPDPIGALWMETDRGNVIYQAQLVAGTPAWVYVTGAMYGTIIAVDQRPSGLGVNDTGLLFLSSDSTSVIWDGTAWKAIGSLLDIGPAPTVSQFRVKANGGGDLSFLVFAPDNVQIGFDAELDLAGVGGWKAQATSCAWISKVGAFLRILGAAGVTPGALTGQNLFVEIGLSTGLVTINGTVNIANSGVLQNAGQQVVKARMAAITAPAGGAVVDAQARAAIQSIINTLSAGAGGHGLIA